eukprot:1154726-Pelagomonas_calceolata.AAC.2
MLSWAIYGCEHNARLPKIVRLTHLLQQCMHHGWRQRSRQLPLVMSPGNCLPIASSHERVLCDKALLLVKISIVFPQKLLQRPVLDIRICKEQDQCTQISASAS